MQDTFSSQQLEGVDVASSILRVRATDSDQVDTPNSIVQYSLGNTENSQYFFINNNSGIIYNNITLVTHTHTNHKPHTLTHTTHIINTFFFMLLLG